MTPKSPRSIQRVRRSLPEPARSAHLLETLEPRVLLSAFTYDSLAEAFDFPSILHDLAPPASVQTAGFGHAAAALGDINGDGTPDVAIAAPGTMETADEPLIPGRVFLYSGATGDLLHTIEFGNAGFGSALVNLGDVDGDGADDLAIGSPLVGTNDPSPTGLVHIASGATGAIIRSLLPSQLGEEFGASLAAIGDLTGDGRSELVVGAPSAGENGQGRVYVINVVTRDVLRTLTGEAAGDRFGAAVLVPGDLAAPNDGGSDGVPEIFVGAPGYDGAGVDAGRAYLYDGSDGSLRFVLDGAAAGDLFGAALGADAGAPSATLLVGAPGVDVDFIGSGGPRVDAGEVFRFDIAGEPMPPDTRIISFAMGTLFGSTIHAVGDIDGDGTADFAIGGPPAPVAGSAPLSFRAGGSLRPIVLNEQELAPAGSTAFAAGDLDADGFADVILQVPGADGTTRARIVSSLALVPISTVDIASDDLSYIFSAAHSVFFSTASRDATAIIDGRAVPLSMIAGLTIGDIVVGVNNGGLLVVQPRLAEGPPQRGGYSIIDGGVRSTLAAAVMQVVGGHEPDFEAFTLAGVGNDGSITFNESLVPGGGAAAWLLKDGVLTFLWLGTVDDVNDAGAVVGNPAPVGGAAQSPVLRAADGTVIQLTGLATARRLNNAGEVLGGTEGPNFGIGTDRSIAIWRDGAVTLLEPRRLPAEATDLRWRLRSFSDDGAALLTAHYAVPGGRNGSLVERSTEYTLQPDLGLVPLQSVIFGERVLIDNFAHGPPRLISDSGQILLPTGILRPIDVADLWTLRPGSPVGAAHESLVAAVVNALGEPVTLLGVGDRWVGVAADTRLIQGEVFGTLPYTDPKDGSTYLFVLTTAHTYWGRLTQDHQLDLLTPLSAAPNTSAITGSPALFETADGRFHLAGTDATGDLVLFYQTSQFAPSSPLNWSYDNLVDTHLAPQGIPFAPIAGNLSAFATPWGSSHIGYLDDAGSLHVVWIPPGGLSWSAVDLTASSGAAPLMGELTSLVTPWRTLHFNAADQGGEITAIWWAPGFEGRWAATTLTDAASLRLDPATLTAFITPWNALHIMGRNAGTGEFTALWWAPATQEWRTERIVIEGRPEDLVLTGPTAGSVTGGDTLNLFARQGDGAMARVFWTVGDGSTWTYENVSTMAMLAI